MKEKWTVKRVYFAVVGINPEHALANLATQRILSEKLQYLCFSQVPAGSDCPEFTPTTARKINTLSAVLILSNVQVVKNTYALSLPINHRAPFYYLLQKIIEKNNKLLL